MEWRAWNGMEWNEIIYFKLMQDPPKSEPWGFQNASRRLPWALKFAFGSTWNCKLGCHGPSGLPLGHSERPSWGSWPSIRIAGGPFWYPGRPFWVPQASILKVLGHPVAAFCRFCIKIAKFMKTIEKPRFLHGFLMISRI